MSPPETRGTKIFADAGPAAEVFAYATDPVRFSEWQKAW
jgi:hypothetical protein